MIGLLRTFSWQEIRHHPWRHAAAVVAVMLGVALSFAVHVINASALSEFSQAVRSVSGRADLELRASGGVLDESVLELLWAQPQIRLASPVLEGSLRVGSQTVKVMGVDLLSAADLPPGLQPRSRPSGTWNFLQSDAVFLNPTARALLGDNEGLQVLVGTQAHKLQVAGDVAAAGPALLVMDIGAAQDLLGRSGELSRIDIHTHNGIEPATLKASLTALPQWPRGLLLGEPGDGEQRMAQLSRAYRVNLTVLALVALFTGAFLVFSVLSLSVAQRAQQFALLGVLGCTAQERLRLVLTESLLLGLSGSLGGLVLGAALAATALRLLGGDLGGGYFAGVQPALQLSLGAACLYGGLGVVAALAGGWWPARQVSLLPVATTLKGLGAAQAQRLSVGWSLGLIVVGVLLAFLPPVWEMPLGAYVSVAACLLGGIMALPALTAKVLDGIRPRWHALLPMLALERAHRLPHTAASAVSGVIAALSLAVALTVMVSSFRQSVTQWLDVILPADVYVRAAQGGLAEHSFLDPAWINSVKRLPQVKSAQAQRVRAITWDSQRAPVILIAREQLQAQQHLPLVGEPLPIPPGAVGVYVSEAMVDLYGVLPGQTLETLAQAIGSDHLSPVFVAGVWRDYARQSGSIMMTRSHYLHLSGDARINDLALNLHSGTDMAQLIQQLRDLADAQRANSGEALEVAATAQIRATSLRLFDRSFAVTYWLQAVAIGIGLFGIAASFSAQVLARRKEFGLLVHLGLSRTQVLTLVASEGAAWTAIGAVAGVCLGMAVSVILVHVVNPQSFHWTMDLHVPVLRLLALCVAVLAAGTLTAWLSGRAAASHDAVLAVKEDW